MLTSEGRRIYRANLSSRRILCRIYHEMIIFPNRRVGEAHVPTPYYAKNFGIVSHSAVTKEKQMSTVVKQCDFDIRNIGRIKDSFTLEAIHIGYMHL